MRAMNFFKTDSFQITTFTKFRQVVVDFLHHAKKKHTVWGLFEVDITEANERLKQYKALNEIPVTLTAWITYCIAQAVGEYKIMQAYRQGKNNLIIFDDVDISMIIEKEIHGQAISTSYILRSADKKSLMEINAEIVDAKSVKSDKMVVETKKSSVGASNTIFKLPPFIRRLIFGFILRHPHLKKKYQGTIGITSVGMFGQGTQGGWAVPITNHCLQFTLGAMGRKPGVVGNEIKIRDYLCITVAVDHDIIDGAPGTRFLKRLHSMVEESYGLKEILH
jgi:pyruvate/2-oxoglutarate dehydrogenase complex dihydrolipoamide acyltransferase (E2) component